MKPLRIAAVGIIVVIAGVVGTLKAVGSENHALATSVTVTESEMKVTASVKRVPAGKVTFIVRNTGTTEHELVVLRHNGSADGLPVVHFKAAEDESAKVGEAEGLKPGKSTRLTLNLKPGRYVLLCNIVGHYQLGMRTGLLVG